MRRRRISPLLDELSGSEHRLILTKLHYLWLRAFFKRKLVPTLLLGLSAAYTFLAMFVFALSLATHVPLLMTTGIGILASAFVFAWLVNDWVQHLAKRPLPYRVLS